MTRKFLLFAALGLALVACEKDKGAGFTGIGQPSMSVIPAYGLDFPGLTQDDG